MDVSIRIYQFEVLLVASILAIVAYLSGGKVTDWCASTAVLMGFINSALSLAAARELSDREESNLSEWIRSTFFLKELLWILTFALLGSYPLLFGAIIFFTYPVWHKGLLGIVPLLAHSR